MLRVGDTVRLKNPKSEDMRVEDVTTHFAAGLVCVSWDRGVNARATANIPESCLELVGTADETAELPTVSEYVVGDIVRIIHMPGTFTVVRIDRKNGSCSVLCGTDDGQTLWADERALTRVSWRQLPPMF